MDVPLATHKNNCRVCHGSELEMILSLGAMPPANAFLRAADLEQPEARFPLDIFFCKKCSFVQLGEVIDASMLFRNYVYVSSTAPSFMAHFQKFADEMIARHNLKSDSLIIDIGSNDGILLRPFATHGCRVLGIDPAIEIARQATDAGIKTLPEFFTPALAEKIVAEHGPASLITGTNVFAHIDNLDAVLIGVRALLKPEGVFVIEAPYLVDLLEKKLFDTIYHEHLSYFRVGTLQTLVRRLGFEVIDIQTVSTHGGSIRVSISPNKTAPIAAVVNEYLTKEEALNLQQIATYQKFAAAIEKNKTVLAALLNDLKNKGARIVGYGAPAKGNTLLSYFGIDAKILDYIIDDSPWKQGRFTPGTHIPVLADTALREHPPTHILILAWNYAAQIQAKLKNFSATGGHFILPIPEAHII